MAQYTTEAILLAARNWGEADKIVTFFSRDLGKVKAVAYGCRRPKSPLAGGMQVFSYLRLQVMSGTQLDTIKQCDTIDSFKAVREDLHAMAYASFLMELTVELCPEHHAEPLMYDILLAALGAFSQRMPRLVALAASFQALECTGYQPNYTICSSCGCSLVVDAFFSSRKGGARCKDCLAQEDAVAFSLPVQEFIAKLLGFKWDAAESFKVTGSVLMQAETLLLEYLAHVLERQLKSLNFIRQLAGLNVKNAVGN